MFTVFSMRIVLTLIKLRTSNPDTAPNLLLRNLNGKNLMEMAFVAIAYVAGAQVGFYLAFLHSQVSPVWPPEGISLALVLLRGFRIAPGVLLGAFSANYLNNPHLPTASLIACGNTASVLLAAYFIQKFNGTATPFNRVSRVLMFLTIGTMPGAAISAFVGVTSLLVFGFVSTTAYWQVVLTWWTGEMQGLIIVAPFIYTWAKLPQIRWTYDRSIEAPVLLTSLVALSYIVFRAGFDLTYLPIPFIIWAIFRFKMHGAVTAIIILSFTSTFYTIRQQGPFAIMRGDQLSINDSLLLLELYIGVFTIMTMVLSATIQEREEYLIAEQQLAATKAKGEFLATLSHEIRTPLNGVIGSTELLQGTKLSDDQSRYVETLSGTAKTLTGLVNSILDYSKLEAGKLRLEHIAFDLKAALDEIAHMFQPTVKKKDIQFTVQADNLPRAVIGDPLRLTQVLINLCGNAVKFTEKGGVTLSVEYANGACKFSVRDTGIGMSQGDLERLFQPFQQTRGETARKYGGTGLGLTISAQLTRLMGADIKVESEEGNGSVFSFELTLPAAATVETPGVQDDPKDGAFAQMYPAKILIVDDTEMNRMLLAAMLKNLGYGIVKEGEDGFAALHAIKHEPFDLVLLDVQMPGMDGFDVATQLRQETGQIPYLVAVTGNVDQESQDQYRQVMDDFLPKPFTIAMLCSVIKRAHQKKFHAANGMRQDADTEGGIHSA